MSNLTDRIGGARSALAWKAPCVIGTTTPISLTGLQTIQSVSLVAGNRVLVMGQTDGAENGIWEVKTTAWTRARDFSGSDDVVNGTAVLVTSGTYADGWYRVSNADPITLNTTDLTFELVVDQAAISALSGTVATLVTDLASLTAAVALKQPLDADLTSIAAASSTNKLYYRSAANTWSEVTIGSNMTFSGGTLNATTLGTNERTDPTNGTSIEAGDIIHLTRADSERHTYVATSNFTWSNAITHEYSTKVITPLVKRKKTNGACIMPTGFSASPFAIYYGAGRVASVYDEKAAFRTAFMPAVAGNVFYVRHTSGSNSNGGRQWSNAKAGITGTGGARESANTSGAAAVIYIEGGKCYDRTVGLDHNVSFTYSVALIGVPDAYGNLPYIGNVYGASEVSWLPESATPGSDPVITGITQANPAVVTTSAAHNYSNGDRVLIYGVSGMTQVNGNIYTVAGKTATTFQLSGTDSTAYGAYSGSGNTSRNIIYYTATGTMTQPGRVCDISVKRPIVDDTGATRWIPVEYTSTASVTACFAAPGSYYFNSGGSKFYCNKIGGGAPTLNTDVVIGRSAVGVSMSTSAITYYCEDIHFINGLDIAGPKSSAYFNECLSLYSYANGFGFESQVVAGTRNCVSVDPLADGFNYHALGANITAISRANPCVVTCSSHSFLTGDQVTIRSATYGASIGMTQVDGLTFTITKISGTEFSLDGIDSTFYTPYTSGAKAQITTSTMFEINPTSLNAGTSDGSNQACSLHEHVTGITINGLFVAPYRDHVTNVGTTKHLLINTRMQNTRITTPNGSHPNRFVQTTDAAVIALDRVDWGGYEEGSISAPLFSGATSNSIKVLNTELPRSSSLYSNVTDTW